MKMIRLLIIAVILLAPTMSHAGPYKWVDDAGKVHYTDNPALVPTKNRNAALELKTAKPQVDESTDVSTADAASRQSGVATKDTVMEITVTPRGSSYMTNTVLNQSTQANLLVDTGSSFTVISPAIGKKLGFSNLNDLPRTPVSTAGGVSWVYLVQLDSVKTGDAEVEDVEGAISPSMTQAGLDGLLGMSFLNEFTYQIDGPGARMILKSNKSGQGIYGGHDERWWRGKYTSYARMIRRYTSLKAKKNAPEDRDAKDTMFTDDDLKKLVEYYKNLFAALERKASAASVPVSWRVYP